MMAAANELPLVVIVMVISMGVGVFFLVLHFLATITGIIPAKKSFYRNKKNIFNEGSSRHEDTYNPSDMSSSSYDRDIF